MIQYLVDLRARVRTSTMMLNSSRWTLNRLKIAKLKFINTLNHDDNNDIDKVDIDKVALNAGVDSGRACEP